MTLASAGYLSKRSAHNASFFLVLGVQPMKETYDWRDKAPAETTVVIKRHLMQAILCPNGALGTSRSLRPHNIAHPSANEVVVENHAPMRFNTPARLQWLREDWRGGAIVLVAEENEIVCLEGSITKESAACACPCPAGRCCNLMEGRSAQRRCRRW